MLECRESGDDGIQGQVSSRGQTAGIVHVDTHEGVDRRGAECRGMGKWRSDRTRGCRFTLGPLKGPRSSFMRVQRDEMEL